MAKRTDEDEDAPVEDGPRPAKYWHSQLDAAKKREEQWHREAKNVVARYEDDRKGLVGDSNDRKINILWANTEIQKGALFANLGNPDVRRAFPKPGAANKIARNAAILLERSLTACNNRYNPKNHIRDAVENHILQGRGQCWLEYEPTIGTDKNGAKKITYQDARIAFVDWEDFRHGPGKTWEQVPWVARPDLMTKDDLVSNFGEEVGKKVPLNYVLQENKDKSKEELGDFARAQVWEIWFKRDKVRIYVADDYQFELKRDDDPYKLEGFFPCPKPIYGVKRAGTLRPRPEFLQWEDQAAELDRINTRIYKLLEKLRYCGVYDGSNEDSDALQDIGKLDDGQFIAFKNFQALVQGGGLAALFQVRDLKPIADTIQALSQRAIELIQAIYEITGISDILRGSSDPNETASAQSIKQQSGSQRLQLKQKEVQRFVRDLYRMKGEIIAEHFEREQLSDMSGLLLPLDAERAQAKATLAEYAQQQQMMAAMQASNQPQAQPQSQQAAPQQSAQPAIQPSQNGAGPMTGAQSPIGQSAGPASAQSPQSHGSIPPQGMQQSPQTSPAPQGAQMGQNPGMAPSQPQLPPLSPEQLQELQLIAEACSWEEISAILRSDDRRNYNINMETDSTAFADETEEKEQRIEYLKAMTQMLEQVIPAIQANPGITPLMKEMTLFASGAFKVGRNLEEALSDAFDQLGAPQAPKGPSPEEIKAQAELAKAKTDAEIAQMKAQLEQQKLQADMQSAQQDRQLAAAKSQQDGQVKMTSLQMQHQMDMLNLQIKQETLELQKYSVLLDLKKLGISSRAQALAEFDAFNGAQDTHERRAADIQGQQQDHALAVHDTLEGHRIEHRKVDVAQQAAAVKATQAAQPRAAA